MKQLAIADEATTPSTASAEPNIFDQIKTGIETTFSEDKIKELVGKLNEFGDKAKEVGGKVISNIQSAFESSTAVPTPAS